MVTYSQSKFSTCHAVLTVENLILTICMPQERVGGAKWENTYSKTLCKGEAWVQATEMMHIQGQSQLTNSLFHFNLACK